MTEVAAGVVGRPTFAPVFGALPRRVRYRCTGRACAEGAHLRIMTESKRGNAERASGARAHGEPGIPSSGVAPTVDFSPGDTVAGKYLVERTIGEGGLGAVVKAKHLQLDQDVVIKHIRPSELSRTGVVERFLREARLAAKIKNEHAVKVQDVDTLPNGVPYMVMEFVDGKNLHQLVAEHGPLSPLRATEYIRQAAVGLEAARAVGLVHRDIKPANLILDRAGVVRLADLGLARFLGNAMRNQNLTQQFDPNSVLGTLDFIAPEQADNSSAVDIRADIYSLGHTLYYLTGGPVYVDGKRVTGKRSTGKGEAKGLEDLHLVTYDISTAKYIDHGAIYLRDGQRPLYVNSIALDKKGNVYTLCRINRDGHVHTDLISIPAKSIVLNP